MSGFSDDTAKSGTDSKGRKYRVYKGRRTTDIRTVLLRQQSKKDGTPLPHYREWFDGDGTTYTAYNAGGIIELRVQQVGPDKEP